MVVVDNERIAVVFPSELVLIDAKRSSGVARGSPLLKHASQVEVGTQIGGVDNIFLPSLVVSKLRVVLHDVSLVREVLLLELTGLLLKDTGCLLNLVFLGHCLSFVD